MRNKIKALVMSVLIMFPLSAFSGTNEIDNTYGDYLISGVKHRISMNLEGASLVNVLKAFSQQSSLNFISTEAVKERKLTLYFKNVPLKNAMDIIFKANGLSYDYFPDANIFVVKETGKPKIELKTKVYNLKYSFTEYSRIQQEADDIMSGSEGGGTGGSVNSSDNSSDEERIKEAVKSVLTKNGKVVEDDSSNSLIVTDIPSQFSIIDKVVSELDRPQPKVMIEVEMLDVSKNLVDKLGIDYANGLTSTFAGGSFVTAFPFGERFFRKHDGEKSITGSTFSLSSLSAVLKFLSSDTTTKFLARPKILTLSGETAEVNLTTNAVVGVTQEVTDTSTTYNIERADIGTKLRVTPQVDLPSHEVTMMIDVYNRGVEGSGIGVAGMTKGEVMNPKERGARSMVRLKDGQTLLIGGLLRQDKTETKDKIPFFGDIPFIGSLFRYKDSSNKDRELLIFLTPHITTDNSIASINNVTSKTQLLREQSLSSHDEAINIALDKFSER